VAGHLVPVEIDGVEVLVETVPVAGSEPTSRRGDAGERVRAAFDSVPDVIVSMAARTVEAVRKLAASDAAHPSRLEVEFGIGFAAKGNVVVASGEANASLKVKLIYEASPPGQP
jgi:hypothetical protein